MEQLLENCIKFARKIESKVKLKGKLSVEEQLKKDILDFTLCLSQKDGTLDMQEILTIGTVLGLEIDSDFNESMETMREDKNKFLTKVPLSFYYFAQVDRLRKTESDWHENSRYLYKTFKQIGNVVINCNGSSSPLELVALNTFCNVVINFILNNENENNCLDFDKEKREIEAKREKDKKFVDNTRKQLEEINKLIGLTNVKREIENLVNLLLVYKYREEKGMKNPPLAMHFVFTGNPGTGKTTIARKLAEIYKELGILEKGQLVEADRASLVAGFVGQTAQRVSEIVDKAMGGVLFIDEAYTLVSNSENDFGQEAIDTLLKLMEDNRDKFVTIVAGYPEEMEEFLESNPGLRSRFNKTIYFEDYSEEELIQIFEKLCAEYDYELSDTAREIVGQHFNILKQNKNFANAREVRTYFEKVVNKHANRLMHDGLSVSENNLQLIDNGDLLDIS